MDTTQTLEDLKSGKSRLKFRESDHTYTLDGMIIPNVTSVIEKQLPFDGVPSDILEEARVRGTLVHALTEKDDNGTLTSQMFADAERLGLAGYLYAWAAFKREYAPEWEKIETRVFHEKFRYAGTLDRYGFVDGVPTLIDIKTGHLKREYALQTAAYATALKSMEKIVVENRWVVGLTPEGKYVINEHKDRADFDAFLAALTMFNWRLKNGC